MKSIKKIFVFVLLVFSTILTSCSNYKYIDKPDYILEDKYIGIITDNELFIYEDLGVSYLHKISIENLDGEITLEKQENKLVVKVSEQEIESIELD